MQKKKRQPLQQQSKYHIYSSYLQDLTAHLKARYLTLKQKVNSTPTLSLEEKRKTLDNSTRAHSQIHNYIKELQQVCVRQQIPPRFISAYENVLQGQTLITISSELRSLKLALQQNSSVYHQAYRKIAEREVLLTKILQKSRNISEEDEQDVKFYSSLAHKLISYRDATLQTLEILMAWGKFLSVLRQQKQLERTPHGSSDDQTVLHAFESGNEDIFNILRRDTTELANSKLKDIIDFKSSQGQSDPLFLHPQKLYKLFPDSKIHSHPLNMVFESVTTKYLGRLQRAHSLFKRYCDNVLSRQQQPQPAQNKPTQVSTTQDSRLQQIFSETFYKKLKVVAPAPPQIRKYTAQNNASDRFLANKSTASKTKKSARPLPSLKYGTDSQEKQADEVQRLETIKPAKINIASRKNRLKTVAGTSQTPKDKKFILPSIYSRHRTLPSEEQQDTVRAKALKTMNRVQLYSLKIHTVENKDTKDSINLDPNGGSRAQRQITDNLVSSQAQNKTKRLSLYRYQMVSHPSKVLVSVPKQAEKNSGNDIQKQRQLQPKGQYQINIIPAVSVTLKPIQDTQNSPQQIINEKPKEQKQSTLVSSRGYKRESRANDHQHLKFSRINTGKVIRQNLARFRQQPQHRPKNTTTMSMQIQTEDIIIQNPTISRSRESEKSQIPEQSPLPVVHSPKSAQKADSPIQRLQDSTSKNESQQPPPSAFEEDSKKRQQSSVAQQKSQITDPEPVYDMSLWTLKQIVVHEWELKTFVAKRRLAQTFEYGLDFNDPKIPWENYYIYELKEANTLHATFILKLTRNNPDSVRSLSIKFMSAPSLKVLKEGLERLIVRIYKYEYAPYLIQLSHINLPLDFQLLLSQFKFQRIIQPNNVLYVLENKEAESYRNPRESEFTVELSHILLGKLKMQFQSDQIEQFSEQNYSGNSILAVLLSKYLADDPEGLNQLVVSNKAIAQLMEAYSQPSLNKVISCRKCVSFKQMNDVLTKQNMDTYQDFRNPIDLCLATVKLKGVLPFRYGIYNNRHLIINKFEWSDLKLYSRGPLTCCQINLQSISSRLILTTLNPSSSYSNSLNCSLSSLSILHNKSNKKLPLNRSKVQIEMFNRQLYGKVSEISMGKLSVFGNLFLSLEEDDFTFSSVDWSVLEEPDMCHFYLPYGLSVWSTQNPEKPVMLFQTVIPQPNGSEQSFS